jgi:hypothetical protein
MDEVKNRLTLSRLWGHLASSQAPLIVDVRRREYLETSGRMIAGA